MVNIEYSFVEKLYLERKLIAPDGIKYHNGRLFVIEGSGEFGIIGKLKKGGIAIGGAGKLSEIIFSNKEEDQSAILVRSILAGLDVPTTFTIIDGKAWIVESQYDHLFKFKNITPNIFNIRAISIDKK